MEKTQDASSLPTAVRVAGGLVTLEGAVGLVVAVTLVVRALAGHDQHAANGYGTAAWFTIIGGAVLAAGIALFTGRRWGRGIGVLANILLLPVAWSLLTDSHRPVPGALVAVLAVCTLGLLFSPPANRWISRDL